MKKINDIEYFLNLIKEIAKNDITIDSNLVYSNLIRLNTSNESINKYFPEWVERFSYKDNINVFVADNWKYFCQFVGTNSKTPVYNKIKMYIPLDKDHIFDGVNLIFDFLQENNIPHSSKVSSNIRFDDIVIRLDDIDSCEKLRKFVSNNNYIKEGLITRNPFAFSDGLISMTWDGKMSYNTVVSSYISDYINDKKLNNSLDTVSYKDFYLYILNTYNKVFNEGNDIISFAFKRGLKNIKDELVNCEAITRILLKALSPDSTIETLYKEKQNLIDSDYTLNMSKKIDLFLKKKDSKEEVDSTSVEVFNNILMQMSKLESEECAVKRFKYFVKTNNYKIFTRTNNIRDNVISSLTPNKVLKILEKIEKDLLIDISKNTYEKYGISQLKQAIKLAKTGDYRGFTNDSNKRNEMYAFIAKEEIDNIIYKILDNDYAITYDSIDDLFVNVISSKNYGK